MVKKLLFYLMLFLVFLYSFIYFLPKENLYFKLKEEAKKYGIEIYKETTNDKGFVLELENINIFFKDIESAKIYHGSVGLFLFYNKISLDTVRISNDFKSFVPTKIDKAELTYTPFLPFKIKVNANGEFGSLTGSIDLKNKKISLHIYPSKTMKTKYGNILYQRGMKRISSKEYIYEESF